MARRRHGPRRSIPRLRSSSHWRLRSWRRSSPPILTTAYSASSRDGDMCSQTPASDFPWSQSSWPVLRSFRCSDGRANTARAIGTILFTSAICGTGSQRRWPIVCAGSPSRTNFASLAGSSSSGHAATGRSTAACSSPWHSRCLAAPQLSRPWSGHTDQRSLPRQADLEHGASREMSRASAGMHVSILRYRRCRVRAGVATWHIQHVGLDATSWIGLSTCRERRISSSLPGWLIWIRRRRCSRRCWRGGLSSSGRGF